MAVLASAGAETGLMDAAHCDGEITGNSANDTIVAGALVGNGAYHYKQDMSLSGSAALLQLKINGSLGGATHQWGGVFKIHWAATGFYDVPVIGNGQPGSGVIAFYTKASDSGVLATPGKIRLGVSGQNVSAVANNGSGNSRFTVASTAGMATNDWVIHVQFTGTAAYNGNFQITVIDATHYDVAVAFVATDTGKTHWEVNHAGAFTAVEDANIGLIVEGDTGTPFQHRVYYTTTPQTPGTWALQQSGNALVAPGTGNIYIGESLAKGQNHNWTLESDNIWAADTTTGATLQHNTYWDVVTEGIPTGPGNYSDYTDQAGTACSVPPSPDCYTYVNDGVPPNSTNYIVVLATTGSPLPVKHQTFATSSLKVGAADTIGAVRCAVYETMTTSGGATSLTPMLRYGGVDVNLGTSGAPPADSVYRWDHGADISGVDPSGAAWTPTSAKGCEIGHQGQNGSPNVYRISALYKIVTYIPGAAGFAHSQVMQF